MPQMNANKFIKLQNDILYAVKKNQKTNRFYIHLQINLYLHFYENGTFRVTKASIVPLKMRSISQ